MKKIEQELNENELEQVAGGEASVVCLIPESSDGTSSADGVTCQVVHQRKTVEKKLSLASSGILEKDNKKSVFSLFGDNIFSKIFDRF